MSILGWVVIALLATAEIGNYLTPRVREHMVVDTSLGQQLRIDVNMTFHALTCNDVHLDVMDVAGDNQLNVEHEMMKQRLTPDGRFIGRAGVEIIGEGPLTAAKKIDFPPDYCGSCYGAESAAHACCNTCNELIAAYQEKQWNVAPILKNSTQCLHDRAVTASNVMDGEGCRVWGSMKVNKVAGNFHIAHGESLVRDGRHIHHFNPATAPKFNVSHTIHSLSFGDPYPAMVNPMDGWQRIISKDNATGLFQYFIRVIPTVYSDTSFMGSTVNVETNQYTISDRFRPLAMPKMDGSDKPAEAVLPGIFFVYELSPFMIQAQQDRLSFLHLLTKLCAILGGIFTVLGVVDALLFKLFRFAKGSK